MARDRCSVTDLQRNMTATKTPVLISSVFTVFWVNTPHFARLPLQIPVSSVCQDSIYMILHVYAMRPVPVSSGFFSESSRFIAHSDSRMSIQVQHQCINDHSPPALAKERNHSCSLLRPQRQCWQHGWIRTEKLTWNTPYFNKRLKKDPHGSPKRPSPGCATDFGQKQRYVNHVREVSTVLDYARRVLRILQPSHTITIVVANGEFCWTNHRLASTFSGTQTVQCLKDSIAIFRQMSSLL